MMMGPSRSLAGLGRSLLSHSRSLATAAEQQIAGRLQEGLTGVKSVEVNDTSHGCGSMYDIKVDATEFK